ncbi:Ankyrin repeat-containing protein BDA1 [Camellia lanceoleosa]|uniref:Ankyrin repeat-containing protein BDA1 n=1 Tax=Camellia lanceoleosa TaxID=1840588 RepID=A0ACC0FBI0_9ERIC|nr:Ankyrin repeat-containing protein BDA1 [Camellia lanceoleosa]
MLAQPASHFGKGLEQLIVLLVSFFTVFFFIVAFWVMGIVKEILKERPDFASKTDSHGCSPLHLAYSKGHLETTRELLRSDSDLSSLQDHEGQTPFHWAAIKGRVNNVDKILSMSLESAEISPPSMAAAERSRWRAKFFDGNFFGGVLFSICRTIRYETSAIGLRLGREDEGSGDGRRG